MRKILFRRRKKEIYNICAERSEAAKGEPTEKCRLRLHFWFTRLFMVIFLSLFSFVGIQLALATVYIPGDTSVGTWDGSTFTLTTNVNESVEITQDNLTLDGNEYTITGSELGNGIYLSGRTGVTITNLNVTEFSYGIFLTSSPDNTIWDCTVANCIYGIALNGDSDGNTIESNTVSDNGNGIYLIGDSDGNTIESNILSGNESGILLSQTSDSNTIQNNTASGGVYGIIMAGTSSSNTFQGNNLSGNTDGILANGTGQDNRYLNNNLSNSTRWALQIKNDSQFQESGNDYTNSVNGISLAYMDNVSLSNVDLSTVQNGGLKLTDVTNSSFSNITTYAGGTGMRVIGGGGNQISDVDASWNGTDPTDYGIFLTSSPDNTIWDCTVANCIYGIALNGDSDGNTIESNTVSDNGNGIYLIGDSDGNTVQGNNLSDNGIGILLSQTSDGNEIYNNNFIDNDTQASVAPDCTGNVFNLDKPIGGNYWSDWTSPDNDGDGFVDSPYCFNGGRDNLPWAFQNGWLDPAGAITALIATVEPMNLQQGIENSLDAKLEAAQDALLAANAGNRSDAINKLEAFINAVEAQRGNKLTEDQATKLKSAAEDIIEMITALG